MRQITFVKIRKTLIQFYRENIQSGYKHVLPTLEQTSQLGIEEAGKKQNVLLRFVCLKRFLPQTKTHHRSLISVFAPSKHSKQNMYQKQKTKNNKKQNLLSCPFSKQINLIIGSTITQERHGFRSLRLALVLFRL